MRDFSVVGSSSVRFAAEVVGAGSALLAGVSVARTLGAGGKGTVSTLTYVVALLAPLMGLGIGEAVVRMVGQGRVSLQGAVGTASWVLLRTAPVGAVAVAACAYGVVASGVEGSAAAIVAIIAMTAVASAVGTVFGLVLDAQGRLTLSSVVRLLGSITTAVATLLLVTVLRTGVVGATLAVLIGVGGAAVALLAITRASGARLAPRREPSFAREGLRYGRPVLLSSFLVVASARVDLFIVLALRGADDAGLYSVALTVCHLVWYAPFALSGAAYPRLASLGPGEAHGLVARVVRISVVVAAVATLGLAVLVPVLLPWMYGEGFASAVLPTLLLLVAGFLGAIQWTLSRALSATGRTQAVPESYLWTLVATVALDLVLIPPLGLYGAAMAAILAAGIGLWPLVRCFREEERGSIAEMVPRAADLRDVWGSLPRRWPVSGSKP